MKWLTDLVGQNVDNAARITRDKGHKSISILTAEQASLAGHPFPGTIQIIHKDHKVTSAVLCA